MRVFVTGGTGFIGTHVVAALLDAGDAVTVFTRDPRAMPSALRERVACVVGALDVPDHPERLRDVIRGHDACVHNAICWRDDPDDRGHDDVRASTNVFSSAAEAGVSRIVYTSSTAVHRPFSRGMIETSAVAPREAYGAAKAASEAALAKLSSSSTRCNVIRAAPTVGTPTAPSARFRCDRRFEDIVRSARAHRDIRVASNDGRQFIDARNLATLFTRVVHSNNNAETYLGVAKDFITWEEIAKLAVRITQSRSRVITGDDCAPAEPPHSFDAGKIERDFGLSFTARDGIERTLRHLAS